MLICGASTVAVQSVEPLFRLMNLNDPSDPHLADTKKVGIQVFSSAYPLVFRHSVGSTSTAASTAWGLVQQLKGQILGIWRNEASSLGMRVSATKSVQRVIQVGTKAGGDPRRRAEDPNVTMIPSTHPFLKSVDLQTEATGLLEEAVRLLYTSRCAPTFTTELEPLLTAHSSGRLILSRRSLRPSAYSSAPVPLMPISSSRPSCPGLPTPSPPPSPASLRRPTLSFVAQRRRSA